MSRPFCGLALCVAVGAGLCARGSRADEIQQTSSLPPTTTNFTGSQVTPLSFQKFDTMNGSRLLDSVTVSLNANITNQYTMSFINKATISESFQPADASSSGPSISIYEPDGKSALMTAKEPNDLTSLSRSVTYGDKPGQTFPQTFSSLLPTTSPYYISPTTATATESRTLTQSADLALFTKTGSGPDSLSLPLSASAVSRIASSSGNGGGAVTTMGTATATVTYKWHSAVPAPQSSSGGPVLTPEPATVLLWGVGGAALVVAGRSRRERRAA